MIGIYCIKNIVNNQVYVGQSIEIEERWKRHIWELRNNRHNNLKLQRSWNKYGENNFAFSVLEYCKKEELNDKETYWYNKYQPHTFNLCSTGEHHYLSEESKKLISKKLKGIKKSEETKQKMRETQKKLNHKGYRHTEEAKEKIRLAGLGRIKSEETRKKISKARKGKPLLKLRGRKRPPEVIEKYISKKRKVVCQYDLDWNLIKEWVSTQEASRQLKICNPNIIKAIQGKRNQAGGYHWKYKNE